MQLSFIKNQEVKNASWLIGGKIIQMVFSLIVSILSARLLGPSDYGLVNYGIAYTNFFMSFCTLGLNSVIIKDFLDNPDEKGIALGSSIIFRFVSSTLSAIIIVLTSFFLDRGDPLTVSIVAICAVSLLFQAFDTINYYFQSCYQSKVIAVITLIAYIITSVYKTILLVIGADIRLFAFATSVDYIVVAILLLIAYKANDGPKLQISLKKGFSLLKKSYHYILSGTMVAIYGQVDKLMLKAMIDEAAVGYYSIASSINAMWVFVLSAIIDSMYPTILQLYNKGKEAFEKKNRQLYAIVFYISVLVSIIFTLFGKFAILILYGEDYLPAVLPLSIITWYTAFSYLGVARNAWVVCEGKQKYLKYMYLAATVINVILNCLMIPHWGVSGAAVASLITQVCTSIVIPAFIPQMRRNTKLIIESIVFKNIK